MNKWRMPRLIRSFWTDISANHRSIGKHRLDVRLRIFYWLSTGLMENLIIFPASAGEEMPVLHPDLRWEATHRSGEESRAAST